MSRKTLRLYLGVLSLALAGACWPPASSAPPRAGPRRPFRKGFNIVEVHAAISGMTIRHGNINGDGGGIFQNGMLTVTNSIVSGNAASNGAGIFFQNGSTLTLTNSIVSGNTASSSGSGIFNSGGTLTVTDSTVSGNTAPGSGGGILNSNGGSLTITNSTVSENGASGTGGGIWTQGTVP